MSDGPDTADRGGLRNVSRVDSGRTHGWLVRFQRAGEKHQRLFSDRAHGGREGSLAEAQAWRDQMRARLGPVPRSDAAQMHTAEARDRNRRAVSQTGVTGIGVVVREFAADRVPYVTAYWVDDDGRRRQTSFSIGRHGVEGAVRLAAEARAATADWHGAEPQTADAIAEAAEDRVREIARPHLPLGMRTAVLSAAEAAAARAAWPAADVDADEA